MLKKSMNGRAVSSICLVALLSLWVVFSPGTTHLASASEVDKPVRNISPNPQSDRLIANGTVVDATGIAVPGASVIEVGTTNGVNTNIDGKFSLEVRKGAKVEVSCIGYQTVTLVATANMTIALNVDNEFLDEVVVVGYGTQKKANLTGAVSTVDVGKTLENRPVANVGRALQGSVPGLTVLNSSGNINDTPSITIRGLGTLSNKATSNPLIVVDGVAIDDISYLNPNDIQSISVLKDAASTSIYGTRAAFGVILITTKSSTTTDKVSVTYTDNFAWEKPTILPEYSDLPSQILAFQDVNNRMGTVPELFGMIYNEEFYKKAVAWQDRHGWKKSGYREMVLGDDFEFRSDGSGNYYADWDVAGIMFRNWTPSQNHNFSVQGVSGRTSYFMSFGYNKEQGTSNFNPERLKRWNVSSNITTNPTDWLQLGVRFNFSKKNFVKPSDMRQGSYQYIWRWGSNFGPYGTYNGQDFRPIASRAQSNDDETQSNFTRISGFTKIKIIDGLTVNADYTYNIYDVDNNESYAPLYCYNSWGWIEEPSYTSTYSETGTYTRRDVSYAFNVHIDYEKTFAKNHNLHVMVGSNLEEGENRKFGGYKMDLLDPSLPEFSLAVGDPDINSYGHTHWGTAGFFARINYDYKGIWLVELNGRYDGSSRFPQNSHWAFFPSVSAGYHLSNENWFQNLKPVFSDVKIRASFGEIGNEAIGDNMFISTIGKRSNTYVYWVGDGSQKISQYDAPSLVSSDLSWERIQTLDIGADLAFFNNDLRASFDWYQRTTLDMLAPAAALPDVLGATAPYTNNGTLRTRGWELSLDYNHVFGDWAIYANASIGDFKSEVTKWDNDVKSLNSTYKGMIYGDVWGFETDRYFTPEDFTGFDANGKPTGYAPGIASQVGIQSGSFIYGPGDTKYKDLDGNGVIDGGKGTADDHGDLKVIGNTQPRYQYSFRLGASWKGIDLDLFFQGVGKRDIWTQSSFVIPYYRGTDAIYANQMDYWQGTYDSASSKWTVTNADPKYPRLYGGNNSTGKVPGIDRGDKNFYPQSKWISHMAYLRLKNLTIGYTLPQKLTRKVYLEKVRIYFSGENLFELIDNTNGYFDPEINSGDGSWSNGVFGRIDPMYRTLSFGIQVTL